MELRHLRCFVALAEELYFSRAAERLHSEQPPLSRTIRECEEQLGGTVQAKLQGNYTDSRRHRFSSRGSSFVSGSGAGAGEYQGHF